MKDNFDLMEVSNEGVNSNGGTELLLRRLYRDLPRDLLKEFQIVPTRLSRDLNPEKIRIYWCHDLAGDPSCDQALKNDGWKRFHRIVFVSNWQMQQFIQHYNIPFSKCIVMQNAIEPIPEVKKQMDGITLAYYSTPHRGLQILLPVFEKLSEEYDNLRMMIFSSFKLYGWEERDEQFKELLDRCKNHEKIFYQDYVTNDILRDCLAHEAHILAYPCIWQETSCLVLMEAMSAGLACVHPNLAALPETAANWSFMYQYQEDPNRHAGMFYSVLKSVIDQFCRDYFSQDAGKDNMMESRLKSQKSYVDLFYNWHTRKQQWEAFLKSLLDEDRTLPTVTEPRFVYKF